MDINLFYAILSKTSLCPELYSRPNPRRYPRLPYNLGDWERAVAERTKELADLRADKTPIAACDIGLRFQADDWAREALASAEMEALHAAHRSKFVLTNWDASEEPCLLLGIEAGVATVRFEDGRVQTMDVEYFFKHAR